MYAIFNTLKEYRAKIKELNTALGYPNAFGTERYATDNPMKTTGNKYALAVLPEAEHLFAGCEFVDSVEYPDEVPEL